MSIDSERIRYRMLTPDDQAFITFTNVVATDRGRTPDTELPDASILFEAYPDIAAYSESFGRPGDMGLLAADDYDRPLGAVWGREYERTKKDGVMRSHPFEITIGVRDSLRGRGVGRQLLNSFATMAWLQGRDELSLGVHVKNPGARHLYESVGFVPLLDDQGNEVLVPGNFTPMVRLLAHERADT